MSVEVASKHTLAEGTLVAELSVLAALKGPILILDVRDPEEVIAGKGGPPFFVPSRMNINTHLSIF